MVPGSWGFPAQPSKKPSLGLPRLVGEVCFLEGWPAGSSRPGALILEAQRVETGAADGAAAFLAPSPGLGAGLSHPLLETPGPHGQKWVVVEDPVPGPLPCTCPLRDMW